MCLCNRGSDVVRHIYWIQPASTSCLLVLSCPCIRSLSRVQCGVSHAVVECRQREAVFVHFVCVYTFIPACTVNHLLAATAPMTSTTRRATHSHSQHRISISTYAATRPLPRYHVQLPTHPRNQPINLTDIKHPQQPARSHSHVHQTREERDERGRHDKANKAKKRAHLSVKHGHTTYHRTRLAPRPDELEKKKKWKQIDRDVGGGAREKEKRGTVEKKPERRAG